MSKAGRQLLAAPLSLVLGARLPPLDRFYIFCYWNSPSILVLDHPWISVTSSFSQPLLAFIVVHMVRLYTLSPGNYVMVIVGLILSFAFCFQVTMCLLCFPPLNMIRLL